MGCLKCLLGREARRAKSLLLGFQEKNTDPLQSEEMWGFVGDLFTREYKIHVSHLARLLPKCTRAPGIPGQVQG